MTKRYTLLTGATGQIGQELLRHLLCVRPGRVAVLARQKNGTSGSERIAHLVQRWNRDREQALPVPVCLEGDTSLEGFGLNHHDRHWLRLNCQTLLHNAATIEFSGGTSKTTWHNNVSGARRALDVCRDSRVEHLVYTSTAYVCGKRQGTIYENELEMGQEFRNEYEHSKYEAERIIRGPSYPDAVTVVRPAIVVGDFDSGRTHSYHSFYRTVQFTRSFSLTARRDENGIWNHNVRLSLNGDEISNLVSVDWISSVIVALLDQPEHFGKTFHLTPQHPTTSLEIEQALQSCFEYRGVQFVGKRDLDLGSGSPEERRFYQYMEDYSDYWGDEPRFDRTHTNQLAFAPPERRIDVPCLIRLIRYALDTNFGKTRDRRSKRSARRRVEKSSTHSI